MSNQTVRNVALIGVISLGCVYVLLPYEDLPGKEWLAKRFDLNLGIDLQGGADIIYRVVRVEKGADGKEIYSDPPPADVAEVAERIRVRIDKAGQNLKEPRINVLGNNMVQIQVAGIDRETWTQYKRYVEQLGKLELMEVADVETHEAAKASGWVVDEQRYMVLPNPNPRRGERGATIPVSFEKLVVFRTPIVTGDQIVPEKTIADRGGVRHLGDWIVRFGLTKEASIEFSNATRRLANPPAGKPKGHIAVVLDGVVKSAPVVQSEISDEGYIEGMAGEKEAKELAIILQAGSLKHPVGRMVEGKFEKGLPERESIVGATLGQDSIQRGVLAIALSMLAVAVFLIFYYRLAGVIALLGMALNVLYLLTILAWAGATLTFPGIAGIALTIGMAVDANILIMERIREELAKGKTPMQAFEHGHNRAWLTIFDANVTTLMVGIVLFLSIESGPVKGFAASLNIGIFTTLISVLVCCKWFLRAALQMGWITEFRMANVLAFQKAQFNFVKYFRPCVLGSAVLMAASILLIAGNAKDNLGYEFEGGSVVAFTLKEEREREEVQKTVRSILGPDGRPAYEDAIAQVVMAAQDTVFLKSGQWFDGYILEQNEQSVTLRLHQGGKPRTFRMDEVKEVKRSGGLAEVGFGKTRARQFQIRTGNMHKDRLKEDILAAFRDIITPAPIQHIPAESLPLEKRSIMDRTHGEKGFVIGALRAYFQEGTDLEDVKNKIQKAARYVVDQLQGEPYLQMEEDEKFAGKFPSLLIRFACSTEKEVETRQLLVSKIETPPDQGNPDLVGDRVTPNPFFIEDTMGPTVAAGHLRQSLVAMVLSWLLMIAYVWFRFGSAKFGAAAVVALVHDAVAAVGVVLLLGLVLPRDLGLSFELTMGTVAAVLTLIGYSVNDTIVIFDRIRENMGLMKRAPMRELVNLSVNQTLGRTILTSGITWVSVVFLYLVTMTSGTGISELALPLIFGLISGTYSTVYIAAPILVWWYRREPALQPAR